MPTRIDTLTDEQRARMPEWRDRWIARGLDLTPADRPAAEQAYRDCYRLAGLAELKRIVWVQSPIVMAYAGPIASRIIGGGAVDEAVDEAVRGAVGGAVDEAVDEAVRGAVDEAVDEAVRGAVGSDWWRYLGGRWWAGGWWGSPAYVSFFRDVCGLELAPEIAAKANAWERACSAASWWWPHREFVIACEPPVRLMRDDQGRLHCEDGPSIAWGDGWALWHWHGQAIAQRVIERPETITVDEIDGEANAELRRVMIERYGTARYVRDSGAVCVDTWTDEAGQPVRLMRRDVPDDEPIVMLHLINSTVDPDGARREYWRRVPPTQTSAWSARNWTCQLPEGARFDVRS